MPAGRHRKTAPPALRLRRWGAVAAPVLAVGAVVPVAVALEPAGLPVASERADRSTTLPQRVVARTVSRDYVRDTPPPGPADVDGLSEIEVAQDRSALVLRWTSTKLDARVDPAKDARRVAVLDVGQKVLFTGVVDGAWGEVVRGDRLVWVRREYLERSKPAATEAAEASGVVAVASGVAGSPCPDGSAVESGLTANAVKVYRAVCAAYPSVSSWGGRSGSGDHGSGHALDIMVTGSTGTSIASYLRAHAGELGVSYVIWAQRIWTVQRSSEGWRPMADRGSTTANHYDHVHVTVY